MTRAEQLKTAATKEGYFQGTIRSQDFIEGAKWADLNPNGSLSEEDLLRTAKLISQSCCVIQLSMAITCLEILQRDKWVNNQLMKTVTGDGTEDWTAGQYIRETLKRIRGTDATKRAT